MQESVKRERERETEKKITSWGQMRACINIMGRLLPAQCRPFSYNPILRLRFSHPTHASQQTLNSKVVRLREKKNHLVDVWRHMGYQTASKAPPPTHQYLSRAINTTTSINITSHHAMYACIATKRTIQFNVRTTAKV